MGIRHAQIIDGESGPRQGEFRGPRTHRPGPEIRPGAGTHHTGYADYFLAGGGAIGAGRVELGRIAEPVVVLGAL
jgi:hypothetical protein